LGFGVLCARLLGLSKALSPTNLLGEEFAHHVADVLEIGRDEDDRALVEGAQLRRTPAGLGFRV
jgi:hypothetical protein